MKSYFAKYLPVSGGIRKGDMFIDPSEYDTVHEAAMDIPKNSSMKAKLFLCSRDIRVGDNFYHNGTLEDMEATTVNNGFVYNGKAIRFPIQECFQVIGEISPEAVWVTEGREFGEDELIAIPGGASVRKPLKAWKAEWFGKNTIIEIKCSQCKTFH